MTLLSFDLFCVLLTLIIVIKLKLNQRFVLWMLKEVKIFLPPTEKDNEMIIEIKKNRNKSQRSDAIVRTCTVGEYINGMKDPNYCETDISMFFYLTTLISLVVIEGEKIFTYFKSLYYDIQSDELNENEIYNDNIINISASFALLTVIYTIYNLAKNTFKNGFKSYEAKVFYSMNFAFFVLSVLFLIYYENILYIDYTQICEIINDRFDRIVLKAAENEDKLRLETPKICNKSLLKIFYSFVFSTFLALIYRPTTNLAEFDSLLLNLDEKIKKTDGEVQKTFDIKKVSKFIKLKQIIDMLVLFLLVDPLLKNYITENNFMSEFKYYIVAVLIFIVIDFICNLTIMKYSAEVFLESNYYDMVEYCENPQNESLYFLRKKMSMINTMFWEVFNRLFYLSLVPILIYILFLNRANTMSQIKNNHSKTASKFRSNLLDTFAYFLLLAVFLSKSLFYQGYSYYLRYYSKRSKNTVTI
jgi:hypothetical protein